MKKLFILACIISVGGSLWAQEPTEEKSTKDTRKEKRKQKVSDLIRQDEEGVLVYSKQTAFGVQLRTNGYGVFFEKGKMKSQRNTSVFGIELNEIKHPKEDKLPNGTGGFTIGNPYIYGKINNFYQLQIGFGQQRILGQKGNKNGVAVSFIYKGGLSIGLLRPYYIDVDDNGENRTIKHSPETDSLFLHSLINGGGGLGKGWGELKFKPGAFVKTGLRYDFGRFNDIVSGIEIGISAEFYSSKIPIMLLTKDKQFFYQGHIALVFGNRK